MIKKIDLILVEELECKDKAYNQKTITTSTSIANLVDIISDIDKLATIGYREYLTYVQEEYLKNERIICDTMHIRNLKLESKYTEDELLIMERKAYILRNDYKIEVMFVETNESIINSLISVVNKINRFANKKNGRIYTNREI